MRMSFEEFCDEIMKDMKETYPELNIEMQEVLKNNGIVYQGLTFRRPEINIAPTIYLETFYEDYCRNGSYDAVAEDIASVYETSKIETELNMDFFLDYEKAKENICYKLINTKMNEELLADVPSVKHNDLSMVFYLKTDSRLPEENQMHSSATILIHNRHMKEWGIDVTELENIARENTPRLLPLEIKNIMFVIQDLLAEPETEELVDDYFAEVKADIQRSIEEKMGPAMYVLSNRSKMYGAASLLYPDALDNFADAIGGDFYILPSSVHETILVPVSEGVEPSRLNEMVNEVNATQVEDAEVLGDHIYMYDSTKKEVISIDKETGKEKEVSREVKNR